MKRISIFLLALIFSTTLHASYSIITDQTKLPILSPSFKELKTLRVRLDNGLEAFLVSDPNAKESAAALIVEAGSWQDPENDPGMAHFLEHMLFLGTEKYPDETEYAEFIQSHGGRRNAFTESRYTTYAFSIQPDAFAGALDRFSEFFKHPLFNQKGVAQEVQAVNNEFLGKIEQDNYRSFFVLKELSHPDHPFSRFNIGSRETLANVSTDELKQWFEKHYSADRMHAVLYSSLEMDQLLELTVQNFGDIPKREIEKLVAGRNILQEAPEPAIVYVEPLKDLRRLTLVWEIPKEIAGQLESKPEVIVAHILGHEGKESLLDQLKHEGLAEALGSGGDKFGPNDQLFIIQIDLTKKGVKEAHKVVERVFQTLARLREEGISRSLFDEVQKMQTIRYQYPSRKEPFDMVIELTNAMKYEPLETFPEQSKVIQKYDPRVLSLFISSLSPRKCVIELMAPKKLTRISFTEKERWSGAGYAQKQVSKKIKESWIEAIAHPHITLPKKNIFLPSDLTLVAAKDESPVLLAENQMGKLWWIQDTTYQVPEVYWALQIKTPKYKPGNARSVVLADLAVEAILEKLQPVAYSARVAGLEYGISRGREGIEVTLSGLSEHAPELLEEITEAMKRTQLTDDHYKILRDKLESQYRNFYCLTPVELGVSRLRELIYRNYVADPAKLKALKEIDLEKANKWLSKYLRSCWIEAVFFGNQTKEVALSSWESLGTKFAASPYPKDKHFQTKVVTLPNTGGPFYWEGSAKTRGNATILMVEQPQYSLKAQMVQEVAQKLFREPFFSELRTRQQTGYLVMNLSQDVEEKLFSFFAVESHSHDTRDLLARMEQFLEGGLRDLQHDQEMKEHFESIKHAFLEELSRPLPSLRERGEELKKMAFVYADDFDRREEKLDALESLTFPEFQTKVQDLFGWKNPHRSAVLIRGKIADAHAPKWHRAKSLRFVKDKSVYDAKVRQ